MKTRLPALILFIAASLAFVYYAYLKAPVVGQGFSGYYTFSKLLSESDDLGKSYDTTYFNGKIREYGIKDVHDIQNNIPVNGFVYLPVSFLNAAEAKIAWSLFSVILLFLSIVLILNAFDIKYSENFALCAIAVILLSAPVRYNAALGQMYFVLLFLFSLSLTGLKKNNAWLLSVPVGIAFMIKGYGIILFLWMIVFRKWKLLVIAMSTIIFIFLFTLPVIHLDTWSVYFKFISESLGRNPSDAASAYQTINSFVRHFFGYDPVWSPHPVAALSQSSLFLAVIILNILLIVVLLRIGRSFGNQNLLFYSALIASGVLIAPIAEEYHYVLFIPVLIGTGRILHRMYLEGRFDKKIAVVFILAVALFALPIDYRSLQTAKPYIAVFAYPKLYSGFLFLYVMYLSLKQTPLSSAPVKQMPEPKQHTCG